MRSGPGDRGFANLGAGQKAIERRSRTMGWLLAVIATTALVGARLGLADLLDGYVFFLPFLLVIALAAWLGGLLLGLVATALATAAVLYLLLTPMYSAAVDGLLGRVTLVLFGTAGLCISLLCERLRRGGQRYAGEGAALEVERLRGIIEGTRDLVAALDPNYRVIAVNRSFQNMFARDVGSEVAVGDDFLDMLAHVPDVRADAVDTWSRALRGETFTRIQSIDDDQGARRIYEVTYSSIRDSRGSLIGAMHIARDVTARVQVENDVRRLNEDLEQHVAELRASEHRLRLALESARAGTWDLDLASQRVRVSPSVDRLFGFEPGNSSGRIMEYGNRLHPDDIKNVRKAVVLAAKGKPHYVEYRVVLEGGEERWLASRGEPVLDLSGRPERLVGAVMDITEHKRVEEALRESEERFRLALRNSRIIVAHTDRELRYKWIQTPHPGWKAASAIGLRDDELMSPEQARPLMELKRKALETAQGQRGEIRVTFCSGEEVYDVMIEPLYDATGAVIGLTTAATEITARKRAEEALAQQLQLTKTITDNATGALFMIDARGQCTFMNPAAEAITGFRFEEIRDRPLHDVLHGRSMDGESCPGTDCAVARALSGNSPIRGHEDVFVRKSGARFPVVCAASPIHGDGDATSIVIEVRDVTEQKKIEIERERLLESERSARADAERASRIKDEFLATLSHELRTPLNAILGWTQLLRQPERRQDQVDKGLEIIERNSRLQTRLISDLLDVSRIVSGKIHLDVQPVQLEDVVRSALDGCRGGAAAKGIELREDIAALGEPVWGDAGRLQQIVSNLVSNAIKFTPESGRVEVSLALRNGCAELAVRDTGQGIAPAFLPHVFEQFRQADSSAARQHGGLGLGLSIVRRLVDLHGGSVRADSEGIGKGAVFTVMLPCGGDRAGNDEAGGAGGAAGATAVPGQSATESLRSVTVLVVDDEPDARELLQRVLEEQGAEVVTASSAAEALAILAVNEPQVLVSDIGMPGMDGYALIRAIRAANHEQARNVSAIALTAFARPEDRANALEAGYQVHLTKPVEPSALLAAVAHLAERA